VEPVSLLGITELEATVYAFLVRHSPATGYRVAQAIGKPIANTYKAIESLQRKGAIVVDRTGSRLCRAVPPDEVLERVERTFRQRHGEATRALRRLPLAGRDDGVYGLTSREQVFDRCRKMLDQAGAVVLLDLFPQPLLELSSAIEGCAARGVLVGVQVYRPAALEGVETVVSASGSIALAKWKGSWLNCVIDGAELLMAFLSDDGVTVYQAIWSRSPFLCWAYQSALAGELLASRLQAAVASGWPEDRIRETIARFGRFRAHESPGFLDRTGQDDPGQPDSGARPPFPEASGWR
jgi:hypothetical protein